MQSATTEELTFEIKSLAQTLDFISELTFDSHGLLIKLRGLHYLLEFIIISLLMQKLGRKSIFF